MKILTPRNGIIAAVLVLLIAALTFYFWPLTLSDLIDETHEMSITTIEHSIVDGEPLIDMGEYSTLTAEQQADVLVLLQTVTYHRNLTTFFSSSALSDETIAIYTYDQNRLINSIFLSDLDEIVVNDKPYTMFGTTALIEKFLEIVEA